MFSIYNFQTSSIYEALQDDLSKGIWENRLLYSFTKDFRFISRIVDASYKLVDMRKKINDRLMGRDVVIYGAGSYGQTFCSFCDDINVLAFCDSSTKRQGVKYLGDAIVGKGGDGYTVISPAELIVQYPNCTVVICVSSDIHATEIFETLERMNFAGKIVKMQEVHDFPSFYSSMYFDDTIPHTRKNNEVFIDAGCLDFDTSIAFSKWCKGEYEKILAFEPNPESYKICLAKSEEYANVQVQNYGLWNESTEMNFDNNANPGAAHITTDHTASVKIKTIQLDEVLKGEKATFIKMDIEGAELNALKGAKETITKYRPTLAISMYHKPEDIWEIPSYILSIHPDYKLYMRHYSPIISETVLYAI